MRHSDCPSTDRQGTSAGYDSEEDVRYTQRLRNVAIGCTIIVIGVIVFIAIALLFAHTRETTVAEQESFSITSTPLSSPFLVSRNPDLFH